MDQARLKQVLSYDPETGIFIRLEGLPGHSAGSIAGTVSGRKDKPFRVVWVDGKAYLAHRLAWLWMTGSFPAHQIDHRNCDALDNRWSNLREATNSQNCMNRRYGDLHKPHAKGVFLRKDKRSVRRWRAIIIKNGVRHNLGHFETEMEAKAAYDAAAKRLHGDFARAA